MANFNQTKHQVFLGKDDSSLFKWKAASSVKGRSFRIIEKLLVLSFKTTGQEKLKLV